MLLLNILRPIGVARWNKSIGTVLLLLYSNILCAQYDSLLHKPYGKTVHGIHAMYKDLIDINDSAIRAQKGRANKRLCAEA